MKKIITIGSILSVGVIPTMVVSCSSDDNGKKETNNTLEYNISFFKNGDEIISSNQVSWISFTITANKEPWAGIFAIKYTDYSFKTVDSAKYRNVHYKNNKIKVPVSGFANTVLSGINEEYVKNLNWIRTTHIESNGKEDVFYLNPMLISKIKSDNTIEIYLNSSKIYVKITDSEIKKLNVPNIIDKNKSGGIHIAITNWNTITNN